MGFEGQLSDADRACMHERDEQIERDERPLYQLMFSYRGTTLNGFVRVRFERDRVLICSGSGADEASAVRALRSNLRELRVRRAEHRPMGAWLYAFESEVQS